MTEPAAAVRFAFVDVDHCLITTSSVSSFARYYFVDGPHPVGAHHFERTSEQVGSLAARGADRSDILRHYYRVWAGQPRSRVLAAAREWHDRQPELYHEPVLECVRLHQASGVHVVLVSASFRQVLLPIAASVGAAAIACTDLPIGRADVFTAGRIQPMVGHSKTAAIRQVTGSTSRRGHGDYAYGDHRSDLPLLCAVDHPVVVGGDPELVATARERNWTVLPAAVRSTV